MARRDHHHQTQPESKYNNYDPIIEELDTGREKSVVKKEQQKKKKRKNLKFLFEEATRRYEGIARLMGVRKGLKSLKPKHFYNASERFWKIQLHQSGSARSPPEYKRNLIKLTWQVRDLIWGKQIPVPENRG
ncbi:hypothetical protein ACE6H2_003611 [Prunus campanulata]